MIAVVLVRSGLVPAGTQEAVSEAQGHLLLIGSGTAQAAEALQSVATSIWVVENGPSTSSSSFTDRAQAVVRSLKTIGRSNESVLFPASPDGRDLAPHVARILERPFFAGAVAVSDSAVSISCDGGPNIADFVLSGPIVATIQVGSRGIDFVAATNPVVVLRDTDHANTGVQGVATLEVLPPDAATMDLSEAPRIIGGGAGLQTAEAFTVLEKVAASLDASMGVTRVITDRAWVAHDRQIGTTGVVVDPQLYISFGVSGAVQHTSGLGQPDHIISVNTDPHCPMMQMSDLAIVSDANRVVEELANALGIEPRPQSMDRAS